MIKKVLKKNRQENEQAVLRWRSSEHAKQYFDVERSFLLAGLRQSVGPSVLQLGQRLPYSIVDDLDLPFLVKTNEFIDESADIVVDPAFLPFSPDVFSTVVLPHVLERNLLPHQVLREAHRVLVPEGHIVLTGFNPMSLMGMQRWLRPRTVCSGQYYPIRRVIDWLQLLGFEVVSTSMFQYAPLSSSDKLKNAFQFLESVGDRWLPIMGGGYMISAKKRYPGKTMVGRMRFKSKKPALVATAAAKNLKSKP